MSKAAIGLAILSCVIGLLIDPVAHAATPTANQISKLVAGQATNYHYNTLFGYAVAFDGDTAVIGAPDDGPTGSVYVFMRSADDVWTFQQKLTPTDAWAKNFGNSVAIDGNLIVVGDPFFGEPKTGAAYVFIKTDNGWVEQQRLDANDRRQDRSFGYSVAIDSGTVLVGDPRHGLSNAFTGAVYVFTRSGNYWNQQQLLEASDPQLSHGIGISVALAGDTATIGAYGDDASGTDSGAVYVFRRVNGLWTQQSKLYATDATAGAQLGYAVDLNGDTLIVGAPFDDDRGYHSGSAYLFTRGNGVWTQQQKLIPSDGAVQDYFGLSVAIDGNKAVMSAYANDDKGTDSGSAYVFSRAGSIWAESMKLLASDGAAYDNLGGGLRSVAIRGGRLLVGAGYHDSIGTDDGAVYSFSADMLAGFTLSSPTVAGCKSVSGKVTLAAPAPVGGLPVTFSYTVASANAPGTITVPAGAKTKSFTIQTTPVLATQIGTVSATLGAKTLIQNLTVRRMGMLSVTLVPTTVAGTNPVAGTIKLECKAGPGPIEVDLASSNAAVAHPVAASIAVPQGLQSVPFDVVTGQVASKKTASISGTANGIKKSKTLTVTPSASVSPTSLRFGNVAVGATAGPLVTTVTNRGKTSFTIGSIGITGTYASWFAMTETCPSALAAGATCSVSVTFKPKTTTSRSAKLVIPNSVTAVPLSVSLSGTGM